MLKARPTPIDRPEVSHRDTSHDPRILSNICSDTMCQTTCGLEGGQVSQITGSEPTEHYGIGTIVGEAPKTEIRIMDEFDLATYERYSSALASAVAPTDRFNIMLAEKNFQSYLNIQKFVGRIMILGRKFGLPDRKALGQPVMGQIVNWLTSFRL